MACTWLVAFLALVASASTSGNLRYTCSTGEPETSLPFCDRSLGFAARAKDLAGRLNLTNHVDLFFSYPGTPFLPEYNMKGWSLDHTCIHGVNKLSNVTVFPHAVAQGATWDVNLVAEISNATATEARILSAQYYVKSNGQNQGAVLSCDGGPLANSAHDPRWGRISETYSEDPFLIQTIGVTALRSLQSPRAVPDSHSEDFYLATRQVTRHYLGYHGARPDIEPAAYNVSSRSLADSYLPTYRAFMAKDQGDADGLMCAMTTLSVDGATPVASCGSHLLSQVFLREDFGSDALIQSDCCDSIRTMNNPFHVDGVTTDAEALALAVNVGQVQNYFGYDVGSLRTDMFSLVANGTISPATVAAAAQRTILSHMRLGLFDSSHADYPFANASIDWSLLDSQKHRTLSRRAAAASTVLLKNTAATLPLKPNANTLAVVGPFAACEYDSMCYAHSYSGVASYTTNILHGISAQAGEAKVSYAQGSNVSCAASHLPDDCFTSGVTAANIQAAAKVAAAADVTVMVVGLGATVEAEGLDRANLTLPELQQQLVKTVAAVAKKLVLVVVSAGGVDIDETHAHAVLWAPYGGEEAGSGLADVMSLPPPLPPPPTFAPPSSPPMAPHPQHRLHIAPRSYQGVSFGVVNPSARLPLTVYSQKWLETMAAGGDATSIRNLNLEVGVGRTYRYLQRAGLVKHYFGFGLSYSTFAYSSLVCSPSSTGLRCSCKLKNTGSRPGAEVAQMYIAPASVHSVVAPKISLVAFVKTTLTPADATDITFDVPRDLLSTAFPDGSRRVVPGEMAVWVGGYMPLDDTSDPSQSTSGPFLHTTVSVS